MDETRTWARLKTVRSVGSFVTVLPVRSLHVVEEATDDGVTSAVSTWPGCVMAPSPAPRAPRRSAPPDRRVRRSLPSRPARSPACCSTGRPAHCCRPACRSGCSPTSSSFHPRRPATPGRSRPACGSGLPGPSVHTAGALSADPSPLTCPLPITGPLPKSAGPHDAPTCTCADRYARARGGKPHARIRAPACSGEAARPIQHQLPCAIAAACRSQRRPSPPAVDPGPPGRLTATSPPPASPASRSDCRSAPHHRRSRLAAAGSPHRGFATTRDRWQRYSVVVFGHPGRAMLIRADLRRRAPVHIRRITPHATRRQAAAKQILRPGKQQRVVAGGIASSHKRMARSGRSRPCWSPAHWQC